MAITVNATGSEQHVSTVVATANYTGITVAAGSNTVLLYCFAFDNSPGNACPSSITAVWDAGGSNQSMTPIGYVPDVSGNGPASGIFGLRNPTTGNKTLTLSWTSSCRLFAAGIAFDGVDVSSDGAAWPNSASNNTFPFMTVTVTSATGNIVLNSTATSGNFSGVTGTTLYADWGASNFNGGFANYDNGAATVNIGATSFSNTAFATDIAAFAGTETVAVFSDFLNIGSTIEVIAC